MTVRKLLDTQKIRSVHVALHDWETEADDRRQIRTEANAAEEEQGRNLKDELMAQGYRTVCMTPTAARI
jgi:hypothetical protein